MIALFFIDQDGDHCTFSREVPDSTKETLLPILAAEGFSPSDVYEYFIIEGDMYSPDIKSLE